MGEGKKGVTGILASVKLTVPLLILLALLSIIGTVIPQNAPMEQYISLYSPQTYKILRGLGVLDMYHSWWFVGALALLGVNILVCSLDRLPGVWMGIKRNPKNYSRIGVYVTHFSVILILIGGVVGGVKGFKGYVEITEGETIGEVSVSRSQRRKLPLGFEVRLDKFLVSFYSDGTPKDYVSTLTFLEGGKPTLEGIEVRVNHPISYKGITFYQSSYGLKETRVLLRVQKGDKSFEYQLPLRSAVKVADTGYTLGVMKYAPHIHDLGEGALVALLPPGGKPKAQWLFPSKERWQVGDISITFLGSKKRFYSGLQVNRDPGVGIVWVGCSLMILGLLITFVPRMAEKGETQSSDIHKKG